MYMMNFDDYANHIYQKHRLAVALAVIKSKPFNVSSAQYLEELRTKIDDKMDDDDITICSDDFLIDDDDDMDDSIAILKDFDPANGGNNNENGYKEIGEIINGNQKPITEALSQETYYNNSQTQFTPTITHVSNNTTFYEDGTNFGIEQTIPKNTISKNEASNTKLRDTDPNIFTDNKSLNKANANTFSHEDSNTKIRHSKHDNSNTAKLDSTYYDSQKTILYTVHGFTQNYTHYSPSQSNMVIPNKLIYGTDRKKNDGTNKNNNENEESAAGNNNSNIIDTQDINVFLNETQCFSKGVETIFSDKICENRQVNEKFGCSQTMKMSSQVNDDNFNEIQDNFVNNNSSLNNQSEKAKRLEDTNEHLTEYSQNIDEYFEEMQCFLENESNNTKNKNDPELTDTEMAGYTQNIDLFTQNIESINKSIEKGNKLYDTVKPTNEKIPNTEDKNGVMDVENLNTNTVLSKNCVNNYDQGMISTKNDISEKNDYQNSANHYDAITSSTNDFCDQNNARIEEFVTSEENDSRELISYKVLEEFNKVKTFLQKPNRRMSCDGYSTDSGYRSDSQIRSSNRSALQLSGNWLDQSGCCLFNYIMQCHLVASARDITHEIAVVLSQLIDRLHEEEKYPSFLEDLLETVDVLLQQVYEGESSGENEILKQDEKIQRILLLNKSVHIQKHTLEKISNILVSFHSKVTEKDSTYELTNIDEIENISYIFHLLEILLKKYLKTKDLLSQSSTQFSQDEERILKRSSITDIWRKKWNPSQKKFEGSKEKKCVLKICSEILNKIVVDCVTSYSLVAYSALKCFNSMQS